MNPQISINEVKDLGDGQFLVRLNLDTQNPEVAISHTETVSADGIEDAVQIARRGYVRWLKMDLDSVAKYPKPVQP
jgi:hypothetical protein